METAHHGIERHVAKDVARVRKYVDHAGMRAGGEHDRALPLDVRCDIALLENKGIGLPRASIFRQLDVGRKTALVGSQPWDLPAEIEHLLHDDPRLAGVHD